MTQINKKEKNWENEKLEKEENNNWTKVTLSWEINHDHYDLQATSTSFIWINFECSHECKIQWFHLENINLI